MSLWVVKIDQGGSQRTQDRVTDVIVTEGFGMTNFSVRIANPTTSERSQSKGRIDAAIIKITRGSDILVEGFIEDVESGAGYVRYTGRSFLVLLGYSTASKMSDAGDMEAEYEDKTGKYIIDDLIATYCYTKATEIVKDVTFSETYGGKVPLHGKKVYQIVREMCQSYGYDLWSDATWDGGGTNVTAKNIYVGDKSRGSDSVPHTTLYGGQHFKDIPTIKYRSSQAINYLRVIGGGTGKDKVSEFVKDDTSIAAIGYIEGEPYHNNMIRDVTTAQSVGQAIIDAKKDPIEQIQAELITYLSDIRYGDWVGIVDTYSNLNTTKRIKKIVKIYNYKSVDRMQIELGEKFDDYQNIIRDLTKGDVDPEPEMAKQGGSFRLTANNPPSDYIRVDGGSWYDTTGAIQDRVDTFCTFWTVDNPSNGMYKMVLVQISDGATVSATYSTNEYATAASAEVDTISSQALHTPLGEIILHGDTAKDNNIDEVYDADDGTNSYIYRDVRPIVGSSSAGFGGDVLNPMTENLAAGGFKITGLGTGSSSGDSVRYEQVLLLTGGTMAGNIAMGANDITGIDDITMNGTGSTINMSYGIIYNCDDLTLYDANTDSPALGFITTDTESGTGIYMKVTSGKYLKFYENFGDTELAQLDYDGTLTLVGGLSVGTNADVVLHGGELTDPAGTVRLAKDIDMLGNDIVNCVTINGNATTSLEVDLRGDDAHRIYYTGTVDNKMRYRTYTHHAFDINGTVQLYIQNDGIHMQSGKKIKSDSGNLAFEVPSGSSVTFTAV